MYSQAHDLIQSCVGSETINNQLSDDNSALPDSLRHGIVQTLIKRDTSPKKGLELTAEDVERLKQALNESAERIETELAKSRSTQQPRSSFNRRLLRDLEDELKEVNSLSKLLNKQT